MSNKICLTLNSRSLNLPNSITNVAKCSMIGCILFPKKEISINKSVIAVCSDLIFSKNSVPLLDLVILENDRVVKKVPVNPPTHAVITSEIKTINIKIFDWETLEDISHKFEDKCYIELFLSKHD